MVAMLVDTSVNGLWQFRPLRFGTFDANGRWIFGSTVPVGLTGIDAEFQSFGDSPFGIILASNPVTIHFQ